MATIDFDAITTALAARWAPGVVTPPAGLGNVRKAYADLPNQLTVLPAVTVQPDRGTLAPGNGTRLGEADFVVRFYFSVQKDLPRELNGCRKWLGILVDQLPVGTALGLTPPVAVARVVGWRVATLPWGGKDYTGVELAVRVTLSHGWAA